MPIVIFSSHSFCMAKCYRCLCLICFFFSFIPSYGYSQTLDYFDGRIIIKYKTDRQLRAIQALTSVDPEEDIRQLLQKVGATSMQPVWQLRPGVIPFSKQMQVQQARQNLQRVYEVRYTSSTDPAALATKMEQLPGIEYAEPRYIRYMQLNPNDPVVNPYTDVHDFEEAWEITTGDPGVIVAIVDGGVNYLHYDLDDKMWINTDEVPGTVRLQVDQNGDGTITSPEVQQYLNEQNGDYNGDGTITLQDALAEGSPLLTGGDTDGNGYTDDIYGWDYWASGGVNNQPITEDNNPMADGTDHGAHVAGIATAETNNGQGIAGTGFNVRYMALKAGGVPDDPATADDESRAIGFGFEGIIYAAVQGADVINCSWGGGGYSEFENDVIEFANDMGALVVAASGNAAMNAVDFPSAYEQVLSVGSIDASRQISSFSNIGYKLDVFATGTGIESTGFRDAIVTKTGTSMSTPVVAGLAGLLKSLHPGWSPGRIAAQIRSSANFINFDNSRQGHGIMNAFDALSNPLPGVRITNYEFNDSQGDKLGLAEEGTVTLQLTNYGSAVSGISLQLRTLVGQGITLSNPFASIGSLGTGEQTEITFPIAISENYDLNIIPVLRLDISAENAGYRDFDIVQYSNILYDVMDVNNIMMSFAGDGTIGYINPFEAKGGVGFIPLLTDDPTFTDAENALFEGGLMLEAGGELFDVIRGEGSVLVKDFEPRQPFTVEDDGVIAEQQGMAQFSFSDEAGNAAGQVHLETYGYDDPALSNVVYVKYDVTNSSVTLPLNDIYLGLFNDWDVGANISNNDIAYSAQDSILYISSGDDSANDPIIAVAHLSPISSALAINNFPATVPGDPVVNLNDGFSEREKKAALKAGTTHTRVTSADVSAVVASGPYILNPQATLTVGFVYAFGNDLAELRAQVQAARQQRPFSVSPTGVVISNKIPDETELLQNAPNPFSEETVIRLNLSKDSDVKLAIYDVLGREVDVLRNEPMKANQYFIPFNPSVLSSGVYFVRLVTDHKTETISMTYIK